MQLAGGVALVTGAGRGIGRALADALAAEGARLILAGRTTAQLEEAAAALRARGAEAEIVSGDVGEEADAARMVAAALERFGRLDVLVNNAGVGALGTLEETDPATFDRLYRTNVRGPFLLMRAAIPAMRRQGGGTIVNMASLAAVNAVPRRAAYAATKWALLGMSRSVLQEVRAAGIRVVVVEPGSTWTEFGHEPAKRSEAHKFLRPEDVAAAVVAALKLPDRATVSEIEIRPTDPPAGS